jgi:lysyl-tRNA synthetase, class II
MRSKTINELRTTKSPDPYPHKFQISMAIPEFIEKYSHLQRGEMLRDVEVAVAGRILGTRDANKLKFYDLHGDVTPSLIL